MKHIWACLILSCTLILAAACAFAAQYNYQPMDADRIVYSLPEGLSATVTKTDGQLNVHIDSAKTDWNKLAAHVNSSSEVAIPLSSVKPDDSITQYHQINLSSELTPIGGTLLEQAFAEFDLVIDGEFSRKHPTDLNAYSYHQNDWEFAGFDAESSSLLPYPTRNGEFIAYLIMWNPKGSQPIYEYYFVNITFTDHAARKVTMPSVPENRIMAYTDSSMNTLVSNGSLVYEIPLGHALCDNHVYTYIVAPADAQSWKLGNDNKVHSIGTLEVNGNFMPAMDIRHYVDDTNSTVLDALTIHWYADALGNTPLKTERLTVDILVGDSDPFPRYVEELSSIPKSRVRPMFWNGKALVSSVEGISDTYAANRDDYDTLRLTIDPQKLSDDIRLEDVWAEAFVQVPDNAIAYSRAQRSRDTIYGEMSDFYEFFAHSLNNPSRRKAIDNNIDVETFDGKKYAYIGGTAACESRPFVHDSELLLYTESENSNPLAGRVTVIYWYDSLDPDAQPIKKEYLIRKSDPFTLETKQKAYTDESQIPEKLEVPVIIISKGEEITDLFLVIERMPTSKQNQIYYDLYVVNADGVEQKLGGDAIVIIPYPDERLGDAPYSFKLAHYHNGNKLEYSEENGLLWRTEHGLAFKTKDFSPFILSWEENLEGIEDADALVADPTGADTLPKTGDHSPSMLLMLGTLLVSILGAFSLRRSRA